MHQQNRQTEFCVETKRAANNNQSCVTVFFLGNFPWRVSHIAHLCCENSQAFANAFAPIFAHTFRTRKIGEKWNHSSPNLTRMSKHESNVNKLRYFLFLANIFIFFYSIQLNNAVRIISCYFRFNWIHFIQDCIHLIVYCVVDFGRTQTQEEIL